ncbi:MAG: class I SAM-dependent methyltransferase [bacterium]
MEKFYWKLLRFFTKFGRRTHVAPHIDVVLADDYDDHDAILDLGGGGEGVIGRLRGHQVVAVDLREDELKETPEGPQKVVADARDLPFEDVSFNCVTAFFFFMYVATEDHPAVISEAFRVLASGGEFRIWDVDIPAHPKPIKTIFIVPVRATLPTTVINTAYGVRWSRHEQSAKRLRQLAEAAGFVLKTEYQTANGFFLTFSKPLPDPAISADPQPISR